MPGYRFEDLTAVTLFNAGMNFALELVPSTGVKGYRSTIGQYADWVSSTNTYSSLNTTSKILTGAINEAYQWVRTGTVLSPYNSGDTVSIPGSGNLLTIGTATNLSTPAITLISNNSGYAAPSNVGSTSLGDKWVFWNSAGVYKGAVGFNSREMWFQSTDVGATDNRFRWFGGSAGVPVEMMNIGDISGFVWNDTGLALDFRCESDADAYLLYLQGSTDLVCIGTNTPIIGAKLSINGTLGASSLNTANGIVQTSSTGVFSTSTDLPNGTTATTQSAGDNSTKLATTAYVDSAVLVENLWDRALLGGSVYYLTPHNSGDVVKIKSNIYLGTVDPFARTQFWNYEANSVIRLGALTSDGDPVNASSEGSVYYGQNAQGDAMSSSNFGYVRLKPNRIGLYNGKSGGYTGYLFRLDTLTNECYLRDNLGNKTFDFNRLTAEFSILAGTAGITWNGSNLFEIGDSFFNTECILRNDGTAAFFYNGGVTIPNTYSVLLNNQSNAAAMIGTENGLMFRQMYYDITSPLSVDEGFIGFITETNWTSTASTQDSSYIVRISTNGTLTNGMKIKSDQSVRLYGSTVISNTATDVSPVGLFGTEGIDLFYNGIFANAYTGTVSAQDNAGYQSISMANAAAMIGTENGILFNQYYYDISTPAYEREGFVGFGTETNWTSSSTTQNSYFIVRTINQNVWTDALKISSSALGTLYGIWSYNSHPTFTADTQLVDKKYVDDLAGSQTPITEELTITSDGQTAFTLSQTPYTVSYVNLFLNGQRRRYSVDFTVSGTSLTWNDPSGLTLKTTDSPLIATYEY